MHARRRLAALWVGCLLLATVALPLWQHVGMNDTIVVDGGKHAHRWVFDDRVHGGQSRAELRQTPQGFVLHCHLIGRYAWPYCGFGLSFFDDVTRGYDLSAFSSVSVDLSVQGPGRMPVKVYLLNYDPAYARPDEPGTLKVNQLEFLPYAQHGIYELPIGNFGIAPWWLVEHDIDQRHAGRDLRNIAQVQIFTGDNAKPGDYTITVRSIRFHGKWIGTVALLLIVLGLWIATAAAYLLYVAWRARREVRAMHRQKRVLEGLNTALKLERRELVQQATHDELTGLHNRVGLRDRLLHLAQASATTTGVTSIVFMDLDHFKSVNDVHGHLLGDRILAEFSRLLREGTRRTDFLCRWGGEEFILLQSGTPLAAAVELAEKLRTLVATHAWPRQVGLTCSFGVAERRAGEDMSAFLQRADQALYRAKRTGRDRVVADSAVASGTPSPAADGGRV